MSDDPCERVFVSARNVGVAWAIQTLRQGKGLSARQLSLESGLSSSYVSKVESGEIEPSFKAFAKLAIALDMTPLEVFFCILSETGQDGETEVKTIVH
jgi:transcriptional regulator with XRE-family HTH domain